MSAERIKEGKTRVIEVSGDSYDENLLEEPARAIREGELVGFPTETVYGIAANSDDDEAVERLLEIRKSPKDKKLSVHIADIDDFQRYCPSPPPMAVRLAERFWPGPLTLVLPHDERGTIGLRMPDHRIALDLIRKANVPVVAPSANLSGEDPALDAGSVLDTFEGKIAYLVDGGPVAHGISSTVVRIEEDSWELLREGALSRERIQEESGKQFLFVCTGNTCRSPMAAALAQDVLEDELNCSGEELRERGYGVRSAGTSASGGGSAAENARHVLREEYGLSLRDHHTQAVTPSLVLQSDHVLVMRPHHKESLEEWVPEARDRIRVLRGEKGGISDPVGGDYETYRKCARQIHTAVQRELRGLL